MKFFKRSTNREKVTVTTVYLVFLIIGIVAFKDFGISVDEWELRILGFANLKYVMSLVFPAGIQNLEKILSIPELSDYLGTHGAIYSMPMAFIEYFWNITDSQKYYFFRHYINHFIFLVANFYFFLLVKERFDSWIYGITGAIFLFLSPRIFAESFYNHKDIIFLSLFIINLYYGINFLKNPNFKNSLLFSITTALAIDIRIMGIIIIPVIILATYIKYSKNIKKILPFLLSYFILLPLFIVIFWPYLWENPIMNFIKVFGTLSSFPHTGYNFYLGDYHLASYTPWHYIFVWIFITTPILYLLLFIYGFFNLSLYIIKTNNLHSKLRKNTRIEDLVFYFLFISPIIIVILLNSTIYNGWRHLYFIYPCLLLISLHGLDLLRKKYSEKKSRLLLIIIAIFLLQITFSMIKHHPFQNVYFNMLAGKEIEKKFEMDYWGLSNKQALDYILKMENKKLIKIGSAGPISIENSKKILNVKKRNRIKVTDNKDADYIIDNYINWHGKYKKSEHLIPNNFEIYKEIFVNNMRILSIYKKNETL
tara:strand:+ start:46 stop:1653 length:1608 start_codon:yes stop_codon:yes gene_type:complete